MQLHELFRYRQPQPRPTILTRRRTVTLLKGLKDFLKFVFWDADSGVGDGDGEEWGIGDFRFWILDFGFWIVGNWELGIGNGEF
jgi:hypothetical protein